jgi:arylsulfatase
MKCIALSLLMVPVAGTAHAQNRPNVVIMLGGNVGNGDLGAYGGGEIRGMPTPRIDSIASQGLHLTQYLVEPGCTYAQGRSVRRELEAPGRRVDEVTPRTAGDTR